MRLSVVLIRVLGPNRLPNLEEVASEALGGEAIPRSVLLSDFEAGPHLLCALGDGVLFTFRLDLSTGT